MRGLSEWQTTINRSAQLLSGPVTCCCLRPSSDGCHWTSTTLHIHANSWKCVLKLECWRLKLEFDQNGLWRPTAESSSLLHSVLLPYSLFLNTSMFSSLAPFFYYQLLSFSTFFFPSWTPFFSTSSAPSLPPSLLPQLPFLHLCCSFLSHPP